MAWLIAGVIAVSFYWVLARRWFATWGADASDRGRPMPGDTRVGEPTYTATLAITINASPPNIWPWLAQMGYQRGGLYSYDWLDRVFGYLDRPSATVILPQFQDLHAGDEVPMGRGPGFPVTHVDPARALVLSGKADGAEWAWQFGLYPIDDRRTRLVSRNQVRVPPGIGSWLFMRVIEPAAFLMTRRMLIGIRQRAERLTAAARSGARHAA